jgi:ABC-type Fe3+-citrate transport system substrate-binding protein
MNIYTHTVIPIPKDRIVLEAQYIDALKRLELKNVGLL